MIEIKEKEVEKYLKKFNDLCVNIILKGSMNGNIAINKLQYNIKCDLLKLEDKISSNYLEINLNQSCKTEVSEDYKKMTIKLEEDISIQITIEI